MHRIEADATTLMYQSSSTADVWFGGALKTVQSARSTEGKPPTDAEMDWAVKLAAAAATDFMCSSIGMAAQNIGEELASLGTPLSEIAAAISEVADNLPKAESE